MVIQSNLRQPKRGKWKNLGTNSRANIWGASEPKASKYETICGNTRTIRPLILSREMYCVKTSQI